jgi:histidinol-phosphate aminotransferase
VIGLLQRVMAPYPLPATTVAAALQATSAAAQDAQRRMLAQVRAEKAALVDFLRGCHWVTELWEGQANFVLVRLADAAALTDWCAACGIRIRDFSGSPGLDGCVRLSIGSQAEMSALTAALRDFGDAS